MNGDVRVINEMVRSESAFVDEVLHEVAAHEAAAAEDEGGGRFGHCDCASEFGLSSRRR